MRMELAFLMSGEGRDTSVYARKKEKRTKRFPQFLRAVFVQSLGEKHILIKNKTLFLSVHWHKRVPFDISNLNHSHPLNSRAEMPAIQPTINECERLGQPAYLDETRFSMDSPTTMCGKRTFMIPNCRPASPEPSLVSERIMPSAKRRRRSDPPKRISFALNKANQIKTSLNTFEKDYSDEDASDIWWSEGDLREIMKREGQLVVNIKKEMTSPSSTPSQTPGSIKKSINDTFKNCVDIPFATEMPVAEVEEGTTTTRGLERYIAPIMGVHSKMSIKNLLHTQQELANCDPCIRQDVLRARYEHFSKVSANFAVVLAECDAHIAANV